MITALKSTEHKFGANSHNLHAVPELWMCKSEVRWYRLQRRESPLNTGLPFKRTEYTCTSQKQLLQAEMLQSYILVCTET